MMKKVCIVTAARSEYGLLRWVIDLVHKDNELELQLVVTGGHLSTEQGLTYKQIEADGYPISAKIEMLLASDTETAICKSMGLCLLSVTDTLSRLSPDVLVVLGDRYELLPICSAALVLNIPIAHIAGGDVTEGAIDNRVRNAVTQMATYHFPGTEESAERIIRMVGSSENVFIVGETNLDNFVLLPRLSREALSTDLGLSMDKEWILCTYHSETMLNVDENMRRVNSLLQLFTEEFNDCEIIVTKSNADVGGIQINSRIAKSCTAYPFVHQFDSLGILRYISLLYQVRFMIGNSSSGIFESPVVGVPVINIGERQRGRLLTSNIISIDGTFSQMQMAAQTIMKSPKESYSPVANPYGDGHASQRIVDTLKDHI